MSVRCTTIFNQMLFWRVLAAGVWISHFIPRAVQLLPPTFKQRNYSTRDLQSRSLWYRGYTAKHIFIHQLHQYPSPCSEFGQHPYHCSEFRKYRSHCVPSLDNIDRIVPSSDNIDLIVQSSDNIDLIVPSSDNISLIVPSTDNIDLIVPSSD